jgi:hypothetical protein
VLTMRLPGLPVTGKPILRTHPRNGRGTLFLGGRGNARIQGIECERGE